MATGDDALAAGMAIMTGNELANTLDTEVNLSRDYIAQRTSAITPIDKGGTGATTADAARTNLGLGTAATEDISGGGGDVASTGWVAANYASATAVNSRVAKSGDTMTGDLKLPNATPATSSYVVAYINGDGRISKGASSRRFKRNIRQPRALPAVFAVGLSEYEMRDGDGTRILGYIAEDLVGTPMARFVVRDADGKPEAIDVIQLLMVQVAVLQERVAQLENASSR